jgi:hypothetical protein
MGMVITLECEISQASAICWGVAWWFLAMDKIVSFLKIVVHRSGGKQ